MKTKYNWAELQAAYDSGLSQCELYQKYGVSKRAIAMATKRGDFVSRNKSEAAIVFNALHEHLAHTEESKTILREKIILRYEAGWMPKAGRCKKYKHISPIAGEVYLDGTWELAVAKWLDENQYTWKRNTKRFRYTNLTGALSYYVPDFWVEDFSSYIEVKGYETALDRCKWSQFSENLIVWKRQELNKLKIL